jgi:hypothetical protein
MKSTENDLLRFLDATEPLLAGDTKKSLNALRKLLSLFPGSTLPEIEQAVASLLKAAQSTLEAIEIRCRDFRHGRSSESLAVLLKDVKGLSLANLKAVLQKLDILASGKRSELDARLKAWLQGDRRDNLPNDLQECEQAGRRRASAIRDAIRRVTPENIGQIREEVNGAYRDDALGKEGFKAFADELGIPVRGSKDTMLKQVNDFLGRLSVMDVKTRF